MSCECYKCSEHCLDCTCHPADKRESLCRPQQNDPDDIVDELVLNIKPMEGCSFQCCDICNSPFVFDGNSTNCTWCEINKE